MDDSIYCNHLFWRPLHVSLNKSCCLGHPTGVAKADGLDVFTWNFSGAIYSRGEINSSIGPQPSRRTRQNTWLMDIAFVSRLAQLLEGVHGIAKEQKRINV